ncbi:hypothetical protein, partial [Erythrobacter sp. YJ-T3-07]|uniref:hypothetical protein n=1 Tax=Erythrobacter sp. YJ-T3-07 TaxID=2793063 RepID=UPI001F293891
TVCLSILAALATSLFLARCCMKFYAPRSVSIGGRQWPWLEGRRDSSATHARWTGEDWEHGLTPRNLERRRAGHARRRAEWNARQWIARAYAVEGEAGTGEMTRALRRARWLAEQREMERRGEVQSVWRPRNVRSADSSEYL